jgi:malonyl-CoA O-methyltransferase
MAENGQPLDTVDFSGNVRRTGCRNDRDTAMSATLSGLSWTRSVGERFNEAAHRYGEQARVQREIAEDLADWMQEQVQPPATVSGTAGLEIGCGTGFLTRRLLRDWPQVRWTITDVAPEMVRACQDAWEIHAPADAGLRDSHGTTGAPQPLFRVMDGQAAIGAPGSLGFIASSLAFQWFTDLERPLNRLMQLVRPGGWIVFSTLGSGSFSTARRLAPGLFHTYPDGDEMVRRFNQPGWRVAVECRDYEDSAEGLVPLLRYLKAIGAGTPRPGGVPLAGLRSAIAKGRRNRGPLPVEYESLFVALHRLADPHAAG